MSICVLLARQRSGTGALGSSLDQHPSIRYLGEVFHNDAVDHAPNYFWFLKTLVEKDPSLALPGRAEERLAAYFAHLESSESSKVKIIDIKYRSLHHFNNYWHGILEKPALLAMLANFRTPIIHLTRDNILKTYVSGLLADKNKVWHAKPQDVLRVKSLRVDVRAAVSTIRNVSLEVDWMIRFLKQNNPIITVEYDELFDPNGALSVEVKVLVQNLLGLDFVQELKPAFVKQTSNALSDVIENFGELADALRETPYSWMLRS